MESLLAIAEPLARPLDQVRASLYRAGFRIGAVKSVLVSRDRRIATKATVGFLFALVLTLALPMWLFTLSPLLFGVPHLASDFRYLVIRPSAAGVWKKLCVLFCVGLFAIATFDCLSAGKFGLPTEMLLAASWIALSAILGARESTHRRSVFIVGAALMVGALLIRFPQVSRIVFAHLHNVVALVLWAVIFRRNRRSLALPLCAIGVALLCFGVLATVPAAERLGSATFAGLSLADVASALAPGLSLRIAIALSLSYVFLQAVHYQVWLGLVPDEQVRGAGTISFRMSLRSLVRDFGPLGISAIVVATIAVLAAAAFRVHATRDVYLRLIVFHGYLELAAFAYLCARDPVGPRKIISSGR